MRKVIYTLALIFCCLFSSAQEQMGTPIPGVVPIKRTSSSTASETNRRVEDDALVRTMTSATGASTEVGITEGQLSVSLTGAATYNVPIAVPPGINGVIPQLSLAYNSQSGNGLAGYGWNVSGISAITRIPSTKYHDNIIDGVDLDVYDRFALDGQRLVVKTTSANQTYGGHTTVYETENFSNLKITAYNQTASPVSTATFKIEYPDGSIAVYGNDNNSRSISTWAISYWQNPQGVRINYVYTNTNNYLRISEINYVGVGSPNQFPTNWISFAYKNRQRPEQGYIGGVNIIDDKILSTIYVHGFGTGFRRYELAHSISTLGYERLTSITEKTGDGTKSYNPTVFSYDTTAETISYSPTTASLSVGNISVQNAATVSGDFDGDSKLDFLLYPTYGPDYKRKFWLFNDIQGQSLNFGWEVPIGFFEELLPTTWLNHNDKLMPMQGVTVVQHVLNNPNPYLNTNNSDVNFKVLSQTSYGVFLQYQKNVLFPTNGLKKYLSGDFNGDGLTDIMALEWNSVGATNLSKKTYFVDLDRRKTEGFMNYAGDLVDPIALGNDFDNTIRSKTETADVNGDGKTDILQFTNGKVHVYTLNNSNQLVLLWTYTDPNIIVDETKTLLLGDYNGDGKTDFIIPKGSGYFDWYKYTSTGTGFVKQMQTYNGFNYSDGSLGLTISHWIPTDFNNDGKTDIIRVGCNRNQDNTWGFVSVTCVVNKNGTFAQTSGNYYYATSGNQADITKYALPIFYTSSQPNRKMEMAFINGNKIHYFQSQKDFNKDRLVRSITTGNGVKETITYKTLERESCPYNCNSAYTPSSYTENYPNLDIEIAPTFQVVSKIEKQSASVYKRQLFSYYGAVSNMEGLGFLGFRATLKTNWYDDTTQVISTITKNDVGKRGVSVESFNVLGLSYPSYTVPASGPFISRSLNTYNTYDNVTFEPIVQSNKVFKLKNTINQNFNGLEGTSTETTIQYDTYNNPTQSTTVLKNGTAIEQRSVNVMTYQNQPTATPYIIGRPQSKTQTITIYPGQPNQDVTTTEELFAYNNNLVSQIKKKGNGTVYITEDNIYDTYGNITKKTISAPGLSPRIQEFEYDDSKRFLKKITSQGLSTQFAYDDFTGLLIKETNPFGLVTTNAYDAWGKKIKVTDYLGKNVTYAYTPVSGNTQVLVTGDDGSSNDELFDDLGRKIRTGIKDLTGNWSYTSYEYDIYDRNIKTSEPYFGTSPLQWSQTKYDNYGRISQKLSFTGKTINTGYNGLTTTVNDGVKTKTSVKNAIGNVITLTDSPGGTINYQYYANGNVKQTNYGGVVISMEQDGWGRKTKLVDPSAGTYLYEYNHFGEMTKETTPKSETLFNIGDYGVVNYKTITGLNGDATNSKTTFTYDPTTKLLTNTRFDDFTAGYYTLYNYQYDDFKRLSFYDESGFKAYFQRATFYDAFGRPEKELYTAVNTATNKRSDKWIRNTYKNGFPYQVIDDGTNKVLWQINTTNARGQVTGARFGNLRNAVSVNKTYDEYGFISSIKHTKSELVIIGEPVPPPTDYMTVGYTFNPQTGNLENRTNSTFNWNETFQYDSLDRLKEYTNARGQQETQVYDDRGRITQNNLGQYNYTNTAKAYQNTSVQLTPEGEAYYKLREGIFFDTMESKKGWTIYEPSIITYDDTFATNSAGTVSLKINNPDTTEKVVHSDVWVPINNATATQYTYSAWVYSNGPQAELFLFMKEEGETEYFTAVDQVVTNVTGQWVFVQKTFSVPANIKRLNIRLDNNGQGIVWFDDVKIRKTSNPVITSDTQRKLDITYNAFKSPVEIIEMGSDRISFEYNMNNSRSTMYYGGVQVDKNQRPLRKSYSADGSMEIKHNIQTGEVEFITYVGGDGYTAPVVFRSQVDASGTQTEGFLNLHRDYQGTILGVSTSGGTILEKRLFDAWGNLIKVVDGQGNVLTQMVVLDRGYTGHEHLQSVGLINMNGRLYDAKLHRFLQPDNFIQSPFSTQSYNRYGYVANNPFKYTDPSGEWFGLDDLIVAGASFIIGYVSSGLTTGEWGWKSVQAGLISAAMGWIGYNTMGASTFTDSCVAGNTGMWNYIATSAVSAAINFAIPPMGVQLTNNFGFSISPSIAFGNTMAIGMNLSVTYTNGEFSFSAGVGIMSNSNYQGLGRSGMETRVSFLAAYDNGSTGFSLGTNFWGGYDDMAEFKQQTGVLGIRSGDFKFSYENDGLPFSGFAGDGNDSYRTAAASVAIGEFSAGFNLFTGRRTDYTGDEAKVGTGKGNPGKFDERMPNSYVIEDTNYPRYRFGGLSLRYGNYRIGINSDRHVRHPIQDHFAHNTLIKIFGIKIFSTQQPGFETLSNSIQPYLQYQTTNPFTSW